VRAAVDALPEAPAQIADGALIDGVGLLLTVTGRPTDVELQPFAFVVVTEYVPAVVTVIASVVAPLLQRYCNPLG
jgi:hypothetical protein